MNEKTQRFGHWLTRKFLDLQSQSGHPWTVTEFAGYLECPQSSISRWMQGKSLPDEARTDKIATKLGDEIYDLVDLPRPDPDLRRIEAMWPMIKEERKAYILKVIEKAAGDGQVSGSVTPTVAKTRRAST
jgi:transcriptional regulator with XRE-family HTH domain